ncbi:MAG: Na+/H+ antiporter NhaC [Desulfobacter sp.]
MKRPPSFLEALVTLSITFSVILIGIVFLKVDAHIPLFIGTLICIGFAFYLRFPWSDIEKGIFDGIKSALLPMLLIMFIGLVISGWIASGTVPYLIYWGLKLLSPTWFLTSAVLICCVMSMSIGSSWTTIGTLGVALMGVGSGLGVPAAITAGAIATGAFFGDKQSPLSDTTNFAPAVSGATLYEHIRSMLYTTLPTLVIALAIYTFLGFKYSSGAFDRTGMDLIITTIEKSYRLTPFLLIPLVVLIIMILKKVPALLAMMTAAVLGLIFTMVFQNGSLAVSLKVLHYGFVSQTGVETVDKLLSRGGLHSMMWTISLVFIALSLAGVLQKTGTLTVVLEKIAGFVKNAFGLITTTIWSTAIMNFLTGEVFMPMLLSARVFLPAFDRQKLHRKVLSRSIEDGGTIIAPMVPWGMCGVFTAVTLGVPTLEYVPYYFLGLLNPFVSMGIAAIGFGVFRADQSSTDSINESSDDTGMEAENKALSC